MKLFFGFLTLLCPLVYCLTQFDEQCFIGPNYWCLNDETEFSCNFTDKQVGLCGTSMKRCQMKSGDSFCKSSPPAQEQSPFEYNGGLTGANDNLFSHYTLNFYWPPSTCPLKYNETMDILRYFCSPYTDLNQPGSQRLALHGLWPEFSTFGNYQGWPQFCTTIQNDWSVCHINGNLCPWKNTTDTDFTQANYEYCLSIENKEQCLINGEEIILPLKERLQILAPGYLAPRNLFINHEWTKHGSCCAKTFGYNVSNYLVYMLDLADMLTRPGSLTYQYIQQYAGEKIGFEYLISVFNRTAFFSCNAKCELEEVSMCLNREIHTGLPDQLVPCPIDARNASDSCRKARCEYISIPIRNQTINKQRITSMKSFFLSTNGTSFILFLIMIWICIIFVGSYVFKMLSVKYKPIK